MHSASSVRAANLLLLAGSTLAPHFGAGGAGAAVITWNAAVNGLADNPANWAPAQIPTAADAAQFAVAGTYAVTFPASVAATQSLGVDTGTVTWLMSAPHTTGVVRLSNSAASNCTVSLNAGILNASNATSPVVIGSAGFANMTLRAGSVLRTTNANGDIVVGDHANGVLSVENGSLVESADKVFFGSSAGAVGTLQVVGTGSPGPSTLRTVGPDGDIFFGLAGTSNATARTRGVIQSSRDIVVASTSTSTANLTAAVTATGGVINVGRNLDIARNQTAATPAGNATVTADGVGAAINVTGLTTVGDPDGGSGALVATNGGVVTCTGGLNSLPGQTVNIFAGSTVTTPGTADLRGNTLVQGGFLVAGMLTGSNTTSIQAVGTIRADVEVPSSPLAQLTLIGSLNIGPDVGSGTFSWAGALNVGPHPLTIHAPTASFARLGRCTLAGGSIDRIAGNPSFAHTISNGDSLSGFGTVIGPLHLDQIVAPAVVASGTGLVFSGLVTGTPAGAISMTGTKVNFTSGGFTGRGDIAPEVLSSAGADITATGTLSIGNPASFNGVKLLGGLNVGTSIVTLRDQVQAELGGLTTIAGGRLSSTSSIELIGSGRLEGFGRVSGDLGNHRTTTTVAPGGGGNRNLTVTGNYDQSNNDFGGGKLELSIAGTADGEYDTLRVGLIATLGGRLNVLFDPPFVPFAQAFSIPIITSDQSITTEFATVSIPPVARGSAYLRYRDNTILFAYCPADFNHDTSLDPDDLGDFITCFFTDPPCPTADYNADGNTDPDDLGDYITAFFLTCD